RHALCRQPPDQRPIFQSDHSPIVECSLFTATTVQFSTAADSRVHRRITYVGEEVRGTPGPTRYHPSLSATGEKAALVVIRLTVGGYR
ncbi:hypothetical protein, partial [Herbiconiux sp.]|uniref:hypothetical protein n=1 Tax=Herbiconiux sp. TaxID=1871186 RepID=UPI0025C59E8D